MKSRLTWLALPLALAAFAAAAAPWTLSGEALRRELAEQVLSSTGLRATAEGRATFAVLPRPRIKLENVIISDDHGSLVIHSDILRGNLRLLPLIAGKMELTSVNLVSPEITYDHADLPLLRQGAIARASDALPATPAAAGADEARLGTISLSDGTARLRRRGAIDPILIEKINLTLDWPRLNAPASLSGSLAWQGEKGEVAGWLGKPTAFLRGDQSPATLKIESPNLQLTASGALLGSPRMHFEGRMNAASPSLRALLGTFGIDVPLPGPLANLALSGNARGNLQSLALSGLRMTMDGNSFEGALAIQGTQTRPAVSGTLASELIILAPIISDLPGLTGADGQWNRSALSLAALDFADIDLRFSATRARWGRTVFEDAGCSILLSNGRLDVTLGQAKTFGGQVRGRLSLLPGEQGMDLRANGVFSRIDSGAAMKEALRSIRITGEASGQFSLDGSGESVADIVRSLDGGAQITFRNGDILGLDLEQALRRLEKRPLSIVTEMRNGRTGFETATVSARLNDGLIELNEALVSGLGVQLAVNGHASLAERTMHLRALARQTGPGSVPRESGPQLMLEIRGPWDDPSLVFDKESLMRRSEAAAPLMQSPMRSDKTPNEPTQPDP